MGHTILVSACLLGLNTRYNGEQRSYPEVLRYLKKKGLTPIPVCPEQLAGLPTPRPSAAFQTGDGEAVLTGDGSLITEHGDIVTDTFLCGAEQALLVARTCGCSEALLKERSPSCGSRAVYRNGMLIEGAGVTSALLKQNGIAVFSEEAL